MLDDWAHHRDRLVNFFSLHEQLIFTKTFGLFLNLKAKCSFESDLCLWSLYGADPNPHTFWTPVQGASMGGAFRPADDHTLGSVYGHSLQMETQGADPGSKVRIYSQASQNTCNFYYLLISLKQILFQHFNHLWKIIISTVGKIVCNAL